MCKVNLCMVSLLLKVVLSQYNGIFHEGSKITFVPDANSKYFGYSVLLSDTGLVIGAPKAASRENRSISPGLVFNCELQDLDVRNSTCQPIGLKIDAYGSFFGKVLMPKDFFKDDMWFGATVASVPNGRLLICAPRWTVPYRDKHLLANGACYLLSQYRGTTLQPLKEMNRQAFKTDGSRKEYGDYGTHLNLYAYAQAGMSIKVTESNSVIIGAPGLLQWTGGVVDYHFLPETRSMFFSKQPTTNPYYTKEFGPDDYLGYSVESGSFGKDNKTLYLSGAPRSKLGYGQVIIFEPAFRENDPLKIVISLRGPQLGSYFGASLCCMDINGDGKLDLLVGAPNYVTKEAELRYDQGAVFVYLNEWNDKKFNLNLGSFVSGSNLNGARFGSAIADLGDVDGDGYRDVAIGAPWENEGHGAVYIYRGGERGLSSNYIQKIVAENAQSFGISISRGFDVDNNNCSDLAIGAINSGTAYLYRCVPTMEVFVTIKVPGSMYLPINATNFTALFCIGSPEQPKWPRAKMSLQAKITVDPSGGRAWISGDGEYQVTIKQGSNACMEQMVQVTPTADLSKPITIVFDLKPNMLEDLSSFPENTARLSENSRLRSSFDIQLNRDCGEDLICKPLLEMTLKALSSPYVPGLENKLGVNVTVLNKDEPAYGAKVHLNLPSLPKRLPSACSLEELNVICDLPAPLHRNESVSWEIELEFAQKALNIDEIMIKASLEDPSNSKNASDKITKHLNIVIKHESIFNISGTALPNKTIAITRDEFAAAGNVAFVQYFEVTNLGPSDWFNLQARISLPDKMILSNSDAIEKCFEDFGQLQCVWSLPAHASHTISLSFKFNLSLHGDFLEANTTLNATSTMTLYFNNETKNVSVITTLVLNSARPIWPEIVGAVVGLLVLATIVYVLYKYGFFTRKKREDLKRLQEENDDFSSIGDLNIDDNDACTQDIQLSDNSD